MASNSSVYIEILLAIIFSFLYYTWKLPIFSNMVHLFLNIHRIHDKCALVLHKFGGTYHLKGPSISNIDILGTVIPEDIHYIMSSNFANYPKGLEFKQIFEVLGDGIFNSDLDSWKYQRNLARVLINHQSFHKFLVKTCRIKVTQGLIPVLDHVAERGRVLDLQDVFQRLTFDTTCKLVTGYDPECLSIDFPHVPFSEALDDAEGAIFMRYILPEFVLKLERWLGFGTEKKLKQAWTTLDEVIGKYISMKKEELKNGTDDSEGFDLLTSYINHHQGDEKTGSLKTKNDEKFLRDTILNLMIAGRDTTSSALTWFLWLVTSHPVVLMKIREELNSAAISAGEEAQKFRLFKVDELKNLVYLHAALCEALRLYPPVPFQHKAPLQQDMLPSGHLVTPKMKVIFSLYALGRMKSVWGKDSWEFKPDRWISEKGRLKYEPSYKFLAFNAGPRTCLGKDVAFTQMKAVSAAILHNYDVQMVKGHVVVPNVSIILYMKHGFKVRVTKRW